MLSYGPSPEAQKTDGREGSNAKGVGGRTMLASARFLSVSGFLIVLLCLSSDQDSVSNRHSILALGTTPERDLSAGIIDSSDRIGKEKPDAIAMRLKGMGMSLLAVRREMVYNRAMEWDIEIGHPINDIIAKTGERL